MQQQHADTRACPQSQYFLGSLGQDEDTSHIDAGGLHDKKVALALLTESMSLASILCYCPYVHVPCEHAHVPCEHYMFMSLCVCPYVHAPAHYAHAPCEHSLAQQQLVFSMCMSSCKLHVSTIVGSASPQTRQQPVFLMHLVHDNCHW